MKKLSLLVILPVLAALSGADANGQDITVRALVASGGVDAAGAALHVAGSLGQPIIGPVITRHYTNRQGFWYARPAGTASVAVSGDAPSLLQCSPNPLVRSAALHLHSPADGQVRVTLHDLLGRTITELDRQYRPAGDFSLTLEADRLPQGSYTVRFEHAGGETTLPILVVQ